MWRETVVQTLIATLLSGSIVGIVLKTWLDRSTESSRFTRAWKEQSLAEVVGPVKMHLDRTSHIAERYSQTGYRVKGKSYLQAKLLATSNREMRGILLTRGHLIPDSLRGHANALVEHYDVWLERFDSKLADEGGKDLPLDAEFDVGFAEPGFPEEAPKAFAQVYEDLRSELYGIE